MRSSKTTTSDACEVRDAMGRDCDMREVAGEYEHSISIAKATRSTISGGEISCAGVRTARTAATATMTSKVT